MIFWGPLLAGGAEVESGTRLYLRNTTTNAISTYYDMISTVGSSVDTDVVLAAVAGTEIQWTATSGGATVAWISGRAPVGGFTLTAEDIEMWANESTALANCGGRYRIFHRTTGGVETEIGGGPFDDGVEFTTTDDVYKWAGNSTDQAFAEDERLLLKLYITNIGVMAVGDVTLSFNAALNIVGNSFLHLAETVAFKPEAGAAVFAPYYFLNVAAMGGMSGANA